MIPPFDLKGRKGEREKGSGEASSLFASVKKKGLGVVDHVHQLADDVIIFNVERPPLLSVKVTAFDGKLQPNLRFGRLCLTAT